MGLLLSGILGPLVTGLTDWRGALLALPRVQVRFRPGLVLSIGIVAFFVIAAIAPSLLTTQDPLKINLGEERGVQVGQVFAMFVLTVAAAEAAIGLAILVVYFRNRGSIAVEDVNLMKG